ncbi:MAG: hypothetical protein WD208_01585 [Dehalococcoidia bacterium]
MPSKKPSRKATPGKRRSRRESRPNVYVAPPKTDSRSRDEEEAVAEPENGIASRSPALSTARPISTARRQRAARARQGRPRSEVFTRSVPKELRKMGVISVAIAVTLGVLTVVLN